jgi:hypothetical protein
MRGPKRVLPLESRHPFPVTDTEKKWDVHGTSSSTAVPRILLVQTEAPSFLLSAIGKVGEEHYPHCEIVLLCREDDRKEFEANPNIYQILTYSRSHLWSNLQLGRAIKKVNPDLVAAVLSRRPIFRKPRLLFFLLSFRKRLALDENLDSFHLSWRNVHQFLLSSSDRGVHRGVQGAHRGVHRGVQGVHRGVHRGVQGVYRGVQGVHIGEYIGVLGMLLLKAARALLFFPRFFYLMIWVTIVKLRRGSRG